jgi:hypothetical protein
MFGFVVSLTFGLSLENNADTIHFDELSNWTASGSFGSYFNGDSGNGTNSDGWSSGSVYFGNSFNSNFGGFWNGFAYSNVNNTTTAGFTNQYAAITGTGWGGQGNYALAYSGVSAYCEFPKLVQVDSVLFTNTTYAYLSMLYGDSFAKKFGGDTGNDPDFFSVTVTGYDQMGGVGNVTGSVEFFLADFRFSDNSLDYLVGQWTEVNLASLGAIRSLRLSFSSSDVGPFGINTPTYVALENLQFQAIPEPGIASCGVAGILLICLRRRRVA